MFEELVGKKGLSLSRLITLCRIASKGSIGAAAGGDSNAQTQYSRQIAELEEYLSPIKLLHRDVKPHRLTEEGKRLYELCNGFLTGLEDVVHECRDLPKRLIIGAGESLIQWWLMPHVMPVIQKMMPRLSLIFKNLQTDEIVAMLSDGEIDLGFIRKNAVSKNLKSSDCDTFGYRLFVPKKLADGLSDPLEVHDLANLPIAILEGSGSLRTALDQTLGGGTVRPAYALELSSSTQIALAISKMGYCGFLPQFAESQLPSTKIKMFEVQGMKNLERKLAIAWSPRRAKQRAVIEKVVGLIKKSR